jgi:hypothetical protein
MFGWFLPRLIPSRKSVCGGQAGSRRSVQRRERGAVDQRLPGLERGRQPRRVQQGGAVTKQFGGEGRRDLGSQLTQTD